MRVIIENPDDYQLVLLPDGTYTIIADCNVGGGTYEFSEGGSILLYPGPLTRALCPPDSYSDDFLAFLNGITNAVVRTDGTIEATLATGAPAPSVPAVRWSRAVRPVWALVVRMRCRGTMR